MKFLKQTARILAISFVGEVLKAVIPLPIPASVYGLVILLGQLREAALFLIQLMPVMFIPAAVGLTDAWPSLAPVFWPVVITVVFTTVLVMAVTGRATQFVIRRGRGKKDA